MSWSSRGGSLFLTTALLSPQVSFAQTTTPRSGYDVDIDLVRPMFTSDVLPGIDVPDNGRGGTFRWGLAFQYTASPLVLYDFDEEVGAVVKNRTSAWLGMSLDISRRFTARISLPAHIQWGSEVPRYAADGFAVGDLNVGGHWAFFRRPAAGLGLRVDLALPTSRRDFYSGERSPRLNPALLVMVDAGRVRWASDLGVNVRFRDVVTTEEFSLGTELMLNTGLRVAVLPEQLDIGLSIYSRFGFANFFRAAESSGEAMLNVAYGPVTMPGNLALTANVAGGRGFTLGYGSSDFRAFASLSFTRIQPPRPGDPDYVGDAPDDGEEGTGVVINVRNLGGGIDVEGEAELVDEEVWEEGQLAVIDSESQRIRIRYAIRFKVNTAQLLPESLPTLDFIADLLNNDARILHIVVEGHSSEDGEFEPNYDLSVSRAGSIWRRLIERGVHPSRLSFRGMGEVTPAEATGGFDELQASRRVVFHIVEQLQEWESPVNYNTELKYPWSGEDYKAVQPRMPTSDEILGNEDLGLGTPRDRAEPEDSLEDVDFRDDDEDEDEVFEDTSAPEEASEDTSEEGSEASSGGEETP